MTELTVEMVQYNKYAIPACDLMALGAAYANKSGAFKKFQSDTWKAVNKGVPKGALGADKPELDDDHKDKGENLYHDLGANAEIGMDDLAMDEEEFPLGTNPKLFVAMTQEVIDELLKAS